MQSLLPRSEKQKELELIKKYKGKDLRFEILVSFSLVIVFIAFLLVAVAILFLPFNNYQKGIGVIHYEEQYPLVSDKTGIIEKVYHKNFSILTEQDTVISFKIKEKNDELRLLQSRRALLLSQLRNIKKLVSFGTLDSSQIQLKRYELAEVNIKIKQMRDVSLLAPFKSTIYFHKSPEALDGGFIHEGDTIATLIRNNKRIIKVTFPNEYVDRFHINTPFIAKYKDPVTFRNEKVKGVVFKKQVLEDENKLVLYCSVAEGYDIIAQMPPNALVNVCLILNSSSLMEDFLGVDINVSKYLKKILPEKVLVHLREYK